MSAMVRVRAIGTGALSDRCGAPPLRELRQGEVFRKLCAMKGRDCFGSSEADEIRELLKKLRRAERGQQKRIRDRLREIGFFISDWDDAADGLTATDFDELVERFLVRICDDDH